MALKLVSLTPEASLLVNTLWSHKRILIHLTHKEVKISNDRCRHRGGPLHLCYSDADGEFRCPWHDRKIGRAQECLEVSAVYRKSQHSLAIIYPNIDNEPWPVEFVDVPANARRPFRYDSADPNEGMEIAE